MTVLAFLHALDWPLVQDPSWWPPYGCALVLELREPSSYDSDRDYRVRIWFEMMGQRFPISLPILGVDSSDGGGKDISLSDLAMWMTQQGLQYK